MGLFKKKAPTYNEEQGIANKKRMREMFNEAVEDGESYKILSAYSSESTYTKGIYFNKNTTSFYMFILGYREADDKIVFLPVDRELTQYGELCEVNNNIVKEAYIEYIRKVPEQVVIKHSDTSQGYGYIMNIPDTNDNSLCIPNIHQEEERGHFISFINKYNQNRK